MMPDDNGYTAMTQQRGLRWPQVLLIVLISIVLTAGVSYWALKTFVFVDEFEPVALSTKEEQVLDAKLDALGYDNKDIGADGFLKPEPYTEKGAKREVSFNERELNGLLARNTDLAKKLAIDLSDDLISARLLLPLEDDFPVLGGQTLRVNAGLEVAYRDGRPMVMVKGVSVMGVPLPNAWLGGIKNIDLVNEYGANEGFWKSFSEGIQDIYVQEGQVRIRLRE
jgi:hypothetical protein